MNRRFEDLPAELSAGELETRYVEWGEMAIRYMRIPAGTDMAPVLEGLPDDRCPSPHWGVVLEGSVTLKNADGSTDTCRAGEAYYWPAGHTAWFDENAVIVEIGPVAEMRQFSEHAKAKFA